MPLSSLTADVHQLATAFVQDVRWSPEPSTTEALGASLVLFGYALGRGRFVHQVELSEVRAATYDALVGPLGLCPARAELLVAEAHGAWLRPTRHADQTALVQLGHQFLAVHDQALIVHGLHGGLQGWHQARSPLARLRRAVLARVFKLTGAPLQLAAA